MINFIIEQRQIFKNSEAIKKLSFEEYGMVFWLLENDLQLAIEIINDNDGLDSIEVYYFNYLLLILIQKSIESFRLLGLKKLNSTLKTNFTEENREYMENAKKEKNTAVYAAYQVFPFVIIIFKMFKCFKYDSHIGSLVDCLKEAIKANSKKILLLVHLFKKKLLI